MRRYPTIARLLRQVDSWLLTRVIPIAAVSVSERELLYPHNRQLFTAAARLRRLAARLEGRT